jgi:hypothetical protein
MTNLSPEAIVEVFSKQKEFRKYIVASTVNSEIVIAAGQLCSLNTMSGNTGVPLFYP